MSQHPPSIPLELPRRLLVWVFLAVSAWYLVWRAGTLNPEAPLFLVARHRIVVETGPEVIAGSTRMKAGLAQKMVLHSLSTAVMVRMGRVEGNRMTHLRPGSRKLWLRALAMLQELGGCDDAAAREALEAAHGDVAVALDAVRSARRNRRAERG